MSVHHKVTLTSVERKSAYIATKRNIKNFCKNKNRF
jgi:hypothetical protein